MNHQSSTIKPVVDINNLSHFFGEGKLKKQILFDINLTLNSGEVIILKGPSGSGKTTLLTLMGGLRSAQSGGLQVFGEELVGAKKNKLVQTRKNIGYIFQSHNLLASLTAKQNVQMSLELHDGIKATEIEQRAIALLEAVGLGDHINYHPHSLSGGQRQRAWIAMVLAQDTDTLLLDEPTTFLDLSHQVELLDLLDELQASQGKTIVMILHDLNLSCRYADYLVAVQQGKIYATGTPKQVMTEHLKFVLVRRRE